jgi:hypothetical protein
VGWELGFRFLGSFYSLFTMVTKEAVSWAGLVLGLEIELCIVYTFFLEIF